MTTPTPVPSYAWPTARGLCARITSLDPCGTPNALKSSLTTGGFIDFKPSPQYEEAEKIRQKNAAGKLDVVDDPDSTLANVEINFQFTKVHPEAFALAGAASLVLDNEGKASGFGLDTFKVPGLWALEVWTDVPGAACAASGKPFGYYLIPMLGSAELQDWTIEEKLATFTLKAKSKLGNAWGKGPYKVEKNGTTSPFTDGPLVTPVPDHRHLHAIRTYVEPPGITNGAVDLALVPEHAA
ncbi:hypothetical protein FK268_12600 [Tsukamurella sputi]|uniref:Uncharacterized protein n=1 Tax=Tsukamurella sputi TaxID=2591848 RepID=A0A5C5RP69_9ACTN|nr:hypothetical protein [Tsukamurella sputi]TWS24422.1 hypothetical protein FK268_12600 [Tsukamurella sputi]